MSINILFDIYMDLYQNEYARNESLIVTDFQRCLLMLFGKAGVTPRKDENKGCQSNNFISITFGKAIKRVDNNNNA